MMTKGELLFKQMQKIKEFQARYFIDKDGIVMLKWAGDWRPYSFVAVKDKRYAI